MREDPTSQAFFETKYQQAADPWAFGSSAYEEKRYSITIDALGSRHFCRTFEPGCSIGILTRRLAKICELVEAMDVSPTAVRRAQAYCGTHPNVTVTQGALPEAMPDGFFDLVVFSEIGYYFEPATLTGIATQLVERLSRGGVFLAVHWLGSSPDHRLSGDTVHDLLSGIPGLRPTDAQRHESFRLNGWTRA